MTSMRSDDSSIDPEAAWNRETTEARERDDSRSRADFEHRAVMHVLRGLGLAYTEDWLSQQAREATGDATISFVLLHALVPDFPLRMGVARLYYLNQTLTLKGLFQKPESSPIYRAFHEWAEEDPSDDDRWRGIIFRLPGCPGYGSRAILHTYPVSVDSVQTRVTFGVKERRNLMVYTLEPLDQLLSTLARTYRPGNDYA
jgi:hypothetical protein